MSTSARRSLWPREHGAYAQLGVPLLTVWIDRCRRRLKLYIDQMAGASDALVFHALHRTLEEY